MIDTEQSERGDIALGLDYLATSIAPAPDSELLFAGANEIHVLRRQVATLKLQLSSTVEMDDAEMQMLRDRLERVADWREQCFTKQSDVLDLLDDILQGKDVDEA